MTNKTDFQKKKKKKERKKGKSVHQATRAQG